MARSKVRSRRRLKTYLGWLAATVGLILAACFAVNCLVDPLWYLRGNVLTKINYPFNERLAAIIRFLPRLDDYDCVIFGTSRASLLPEEKIEGYRCYNLSISDGIAAEYVLYAKYLRERGFKPRLIIVDVKRAEFLGPEPGGRGAGLCPYRVLAAIDLRQLSVDRCARFLDSHVARRRAAPSLL